MFQHEAGRVRIGGRTFSEAFFKRQEPEYTLPEGAIGVDYVPGSHYAISYPNRVQGMGETWDEGDTYIRKLGEYQQALEAEGAENPMPAATVPAWEQLKKSLRQTVIFQKMYKQAAPNDPSAWTLLMGCLNSNSPPNDQGRLADFEMAIADLRIALGSDDFTAAQLTELNQLLEDCAFDLVLS